MERVWIGRWPRILQITFMRAIFGGAADTPQSTRARVTPTPRRSNNGCRWRSRWSIRHPIYLNGDGPVLTGFLKLITLPMWILFWGIAKLFKARAVVRSGAASTP